MAQNNPGKQDSAKNKTTSDERSFLKNDLPLIRKSLIVLVVCLSLSVALVWASRAFQLNLQGQLSQTLTEHNEINNKLHQAENDRQEIQDYQPKFIALREQGFIGEERRLDWVEQIRLIQENRKLLPIAYEISAQQIIQPDPEILLGDLELHSSQMKLQMSLLHEGDLFNFMSDLKHAGFYTVQGCKIKRPVADSENVHLPLTAECSIYWLTLGEPANNPEPEPQ